MRSSILRIVRSPLSIVLAAFAVRIVCIVAAHTYRMERYPWNVFEMATLARSLALGQGFSAPYGGGTGPSAWTPPIYPWAVSLAFRAFGIYTQAAAFAVLAFNSVFSALTCWTIYAIGRRLFNETVAVLTAWIWVFLPYAIAYSVVWVWETTLSAFLLSLLFLITLKMEGDGRLRSWLGYGVLWGIAALVNTALIAWLPFSGCWLAWQLHRRRTAFLLPVALSAVFFWLTLTPWLVRNYAVFGEPVFLRDNFGNELRVGNNPLAEGMEVLSYHAAARITLFKQMGEPAMCAEQGHDAEEWIAVHPQRFAVLCLRRLAFYWAGLPRTWGGIPKHGWEQVKNMLFLACALLALAGLWLAYKRAVHGVFLFASLFFSYPLVYYITFPQPRYRHPIEPEMALLAVFFLLSLPSVLRGRTKEQGRTETPVASGVA